MCKFSVCVPTLNASLYWADWWVHTSQQTRFPNKILILDSSSEDDTRLLATQAKCDVRRIAREAFDHGGTRQIAVEILGDSDIIIFMTQDAVPADPNCFENLLKYFDDPDVGMAYGRQIPHSEAKPIEAHARLFNYPEKSRVKSLSDTGELGIKAPFASNSFCAYRRVALQEVGGFPERVILGEDMFVGAKMLMTGKQIAYVSEACVRHSHNYSVAEEFKRYFDIGVFHAREPWLLQTFGGASGEGVKFLRSELHFIARRAWWLVPAVLLKTLAKYVGYQLGRIEYMIPFGIKRQLSMSKSFWHTDC